MLIEIVVAALAGVVWGWGLPLLLRYLGIQRSVTREVKIFWILTCGVFSTMLVVFWQESLLHLVLFWMVLACLALQGAMDWLEGVVDDSVTAVFFVVALVVRATGWGAGWLDSFWAFLGVVGCSALLAWRQCLGWGDVALLAVLAVLLGFWELLALLFFSLVPAGIVAVLWIISGRADRKDQWPLVPWLVLGFLLTQVVLWRPW